MGKRNLRSVDFENYAIVYKWVDEKLENYMINVESWIVAAFLDLPKTANEQAVSDLDEWIQIYLPKRLVNELWQFVQDNP